MTRVLHVANFGWFSRGGKRGDAVGRHYATERKLSAGMVRGGCCVWDFSYRDAARRWSPLGMKSAGTARMNAELVSLARSFRPEVVLLGHAESVSADALAAIRDEAPGVKIAQWWVDQRRDWLREEPHLREKIPLLDAFFSTSGSAHARAALGDPPCPVFFMPNPVDESVEIHRAFESDCARDVFFAGGATPSRLALVARLREELPDLRLSFCGLAGDDYLGGAALHAAIGESRTGLNLSQFSDVPYYVSARMAQLTGNGCVALTPRAPGLDSLFGEDEAAYYEGDDGLIARIRALAADDESRRRIARAGWLRAHRDYNNRRVARFVLEAACGGEFSERYGWESF